MKLHYALLPYALLPYYTMHYYHTLEINYHHYYELALLKIRGSNSPLQKREGTGASFLYWLDWKSKH